MRGSVVESWRVSARKRDARESLETMNESTSARASVRPDAALESAELGAAAGVDAEREIVTLAPAMLSGMRIGDGVGLRECALSWTGVSGHRPDRRKREDAHGVGAGHRLVKLAVDVLLRQVLRDGGGALRATGRYERWLLERKKERAPRVVLVL